MLEYLKKEANRTVTENGAATYASTGSDCLDLFATIGALRHASDAEIESRFLRAFAENRDIAMKLLFFARDVRGGLGERRVFRVILRWLAQNEPASVRKNLTFIAEYGRYDDLLVLMGTPCERDMLDALKEQLERDLEALANGENVSLLAKWLPSVNASSKDTVYCAKRIARHFGLSDAAYRRALTSLRAHIRIIENHLRKRDYSFEYSMQPSKAMYKYRKAFLRNDGARYSQFLEGVLRGSERLHTGTLLPYEIIAPFFHRNVSDEERKAIHATWMSQEDLGDTENALVVIDGSGSMYGGPEPRPIIVALSLGIYFAERNEGAFKNHFITFSEIPQLVEIKGEDILDRVRYCHNFNEVANTDLSRVFELILDAAKKNSVPQEQLPKKLYIISDMEFDRCVSNADSINFKNAKARFEAHGYRLPDIIFWNVASRRRQQPVTVNEQGVALVSGCTPRMFSMVAGGIMNPYSLMLEVIEDERYARIAA